MNVRFFDYRTKYGELYFVIQGGPKKNNTESLSNIHNELNTCKSSISKSL